jgi:hypothetical protein
MLHLLIIEQRTHHKVIQFQGRQSKQIRTGKNGECIKKLIGFVEITEQSTQTRRTNSVMPRREGMWFREKTK